MGSQKAPLRTANRRVVVLLSLLLAFVFIFGLVQALVASEGNSAAASDEDRQNIANADDIRVSQEITSTMTFDEALDAYLDAHTMTMQEAQALGLVAPEYSILSDTLTSTIYMPIIFRALPSLSISATRPNSSNDWTVSWQDLNSDGVTNYELQEAQQPDFSDADTFTLGAVTQYTVNNHDPSPYNVYYYRVRALKNGQVGPWSDTLQVVGGYRDGFIDRTTGWEIRRTTFIEEVKTWYEPVPPDSPTWLIMQVEDSWDWGIASPGMPAPEPPYVINYRVKAANLGNLVSYGVVFGGDWPGEICPDKSTVAGWYEHELCFNEFYNTNTIWFSDLKLLFERVDNLVWCPSCGGSPMKRLGDIDSDNTKDLSNVDPDGWNTYRVEVRESGIKFYANGSFQFEYGDTRYINQPYFGVFASTDEYSNSTARFEYIEVLPLDN